MGATLNYKSYVGPFFNLRQRNMDTEKGTNIRFWSVEDKFFKIYLISLFLKWGESKDIREEREYY